MKQGGLFSFDPPSQPAADAAVREAEELVRLATENLREALANGPQSPLFESGASLSAYRELLPEEIAEATQGRNVVIREDWDDVPQALFLSWNEARQLDYCMRRDLHAATIAILDNSDEPGLGRGWFLARARGYAEDLNKLIGRMNG